MLPFAKMNYCENNQFMYHTAPRTLLDPWDRWRASHCLVRDRTCVCGACRSACCVLLAALTSHICTGRVRPEVTCLSCHDELTAGDWWCSPDHDESSPVSFIQTLTDTHCHTTRPQLHIMLSSCQRCKCQNTQQHTDRRLAAGTINLSSYIKSAVVLLNYYSPYLSSTTQ